MENVFIHATDYMALRISLLIESDAVTTTPVSTTPGHVFLSDVSVKSVLLFSMMKSTFSGQPGLHQLVRDVGVTS